jgi:putative two-component system protein, hydrogenase maturation factor HypX/HoxX
MGGSDYFSNGIHLHVIEAAESPAAESWRNLNAINDVVREIIETDSQLVISALRGDAAAGGVAMALAADYVIGRAEMTARLFNPPFTPIGAHQAVQTGLLDAAFGDTLHSFHEHVRDLAERVATDVRLEKRLADKRHRRARDEHAKPLHTYRSEELAESVRCFFGPNPGYHQARRRFVYKLPTDTHKRPPKRDSV